MKNLLFILFLGTFTTLFSVPNDLALQQESVRKDFGRSNLNENSEIETCTGCRQGGKTKKKKGFPSFRRNHHVR